MFVRTSRHGHGHLSQSVCLHHTVRHISSPMMNTNNQTDDLYLYMEKDGSIVAVLLDNVENMFQHPRADTKSSVRRQAPQGHYVELQLTVSNLTLLLGVWSTKIQENWILCKENLPAGALHVHSTTDRPNHNVVEVRQLRQLTRFKHILDKHLENTVRRYRFTTL